MTTISQPIPDRSSPGSKRTAPSVAHQDGGRKYVTGVTTSKIRARNNITIGTWKVRTLRMAGKLEDLSYEMSRYRWNILGLCEVRWKNFGETSTEEGYKLYLSGKEDKHEHGVGFLVRKDIMNTVMGCRPVSSRLIVHLTSQLYRPTPLPRTMMMMQLRTSMTTCRKSLTSPLRKTSLLC